MTESKSLGRIEMFSDGVFAIAITLLILEIKVPHLESVHSKEDLIKALIHLWPSFFAFFYSFAGILIQWTMHHNTFLHLERTSHSFLYANGFLLLTIVFFPFPTALLAEYINTPYAMPAIVFYGGASVVNSFGWFLFVRTLAKPWRLFHDAYVTEYNKFRKSNRYAMLIYSSSTLLAIWFPYPALLFNVVLWVLWVYLSMISKE